MKRTLCALTALFMCVVGVPANADTRASSVTLAGTPGHSGSFVLPADSELEVWGELWDASNRDPGRLVGPKPGDWTGLLLEDSTGTLLQGAICVRLTTQGSIPLGCIPVGDPPTSIHHGKYTFRILGNGTRALRLTMPASGLRSPIVSTARTASARGVVTFTGGEAWAPVWDDTLTLKAKAETLVLDGQQSSASPAPQAGALSGAGCVSQTTQPCLPLPYGPHVYIGSFLMEWLEYPPGSLMVGDHAWLGSMAGTALGHFRLAAVLPV